MTRDGWAKKLAESVTCPGCADQYNMDDNGDVVHVPSVVRLLHKEHKRVVRVVKREIERVEKDQHSYRGHEKTVALAVLENILAALQKGRT